MKTAVHLASQNMPMLKRLLAKVGMVALLVVFGGRCGRLIAAVLVDWKAVTISNGDGCWGCLIVDAMEWGCWHEVMAAGSRVCNCCVVM